VTSIQKAFHDLSDAEARLLWDVLSMHVENERCNNEVENPEESPAFKLAEGLLERVEAAFIERFDGE